MLVEWAHYLAGWIAGFALQNPSYLGNTGNPFQLKDEARCPHESEEQVVFLEGDSC